ncbi:MAG: HNH endonuclease signature motif containing protein [Candidatus Altiarchaeota archaeon]|nr:HNH endonuclease signature motif containing protein [Candidatus Altiarchaeota archaeon]
MSRNPFAINVKPMNVWGSYDAKSDKRTLGIRDKRFLFERANERCENPKCKKKLDFFYMEVGHKTAASKGGKATLRNSVCLCHNCNKKQGTDSWATFLRKQKVKGSTKTVTTGKGQKGRAVRKKGTRKSKKDSNPLNFGEGLFSGKPPKSIWG